MVSIRTRNWSRGKVKHYMSWLKSQGIRLFGVAELSKINIFEPPFTYGISLGIKLPNGVVDEVMEGPTHTYFHTYRTTNALLDKVAYQLTLKLEEEGNRALYIPASQTVDRQAIRGRVSHKQVACGAGLGYIGKSALFVSYEFGPRVRLSTVLTDGDLSDVQRQLTEMQGIAARREDGQCGSCDLCWKACPCGAISGIEYVSGMAREDFFDAEKCGNYMKKAYQHIGRGAVCGICMAVCPKGKGRF